MASKWRAKRASNDASERKKVTMCDEMEFNDWMDVATDDKCEHMDDTTYCWSSAVILMHRIRAL